MKSASIAAVRPCVAFVLSSLKFGGGERVALNLAHALKAKGYDVHFLLMSQEGEFLQEASDKFKVVDLACSRTWKLPLRLGRYLAEEQPDALISSFWKLNLCACAARIAKPSCKLVLWEHSPPSRSKNSPVWLYGLTATFAYQLATKVVAVSSGVLSDVRRITAGLQRKTMVIFNPVPPPREAAALLRNRSGTGKIIWVGRLDVPKNPLLALEAFALLADSRDCSLQIVGDGSLREALERRVRQLGLEARVSILGYRKDAYALMGDSDLLVLSSDREGLPTVLVEALYCGLRIVATDCGEGIHDILLDGRYGTIVSPGNKEALAAAMQRELATPRNPRVQQEGAERFLPERIVHEFISAMRLGETP